MSSAPLIVQELSRPVEGNPAGCQYRTLLSADRVPSDHMATGVAFIEPGNELRIHRHATPEVYFILEGEGVMTLGDAENRVGANTAIYVPGNCVHGIRNVGTTTLRFFYVFPTPAFSDVVYDYDVPAPVNRL